MRRLLKDLFIYLITEIRKQDDLKKELDIMKKKIEQYNMERMRRQ